MSLLDYLRLARNVLIVWLAVSIVVTVPTGMWLRRCREQQTRDPDPATGPIPVVHDRPHLTDHT